jgi:hypothetical protein
MCLVRKWPGKRLQFELSESVERVGSSEFISIKIQNLNAIVRFRIWPLKMPYSRACRVKFTILKTS